MSRKPLVFLNGMHYYGSMNEPYINILNDYISSGKSLIDGDILLGKDEYHLYYKTQLISIGEHMNVLIPENVTNSFNDLIDTFRNSIITCREYNIFLKFRLHETDKTFLEIAQILGREKIKDIIIYFTTLFITLTNHVKKIKIDINQPNKIEYLKKSYELSFEPHISVVINCSSSLIFDKKENTPENEQCDHGFPGGYIQQNIEGYYIDEEKFFAKTSDTLVKNITGPQSVINNKISNLFIGEYGEVKIIYKTPPGFILKRLNNETYGTPLKYITQKCEYVNYQSKYRQELIKDICIALAPLTLPAYVLLEIIDWISCIIHEKHFTKINLIISLIKSIRKIKQK